MTEIDQKELDKFVKKNGNNEELKDIYSKDILDQNKDYGWDQNFTLIQILKLKKCIILFLEN